MGRAHRREDRARHRDGAARGAAGLLVRRLGGCPDHRPGRDCSPAAAAPGRIFHNQVALSGKVPQICCLFGPSAAGGAYIPSFTDLVIMVEGNASMYLGSPRMAEMVVGEKVSLEEMGGARMHCTVSGVGDLLARDDTEAIELAQALLLLPAVELALASCRRTHPEEPAQPLTRHTVPERESQPFDIHEVIDGLVDDDVVLRDQAAVRRRAGRRASGGWPARRSASSRTTRRSRAACSSPTAPTRLPASSGCATRSRSRSSTWPTCPAS